MNDMQEFIIEHPFWTSLPFSFLLSICMMKIVEIQVRKSNPDKSIWIDRKIFWLIVLLGTPLISGLLLLKSKVSAITLLLIIGLPGALISLIKKR